MEGRIIAIRVTDEDFGKLEELKRQKGVGWNRLLLQPIVDIFAVSLESAVAKTPKEEKPPKADKTKKAGKKAKKAAVKTGTPAPADEGKLITEDPAGEA